MEWEDMFGPAAQQPGQARQVSTALATLQAACDTEPPASLMVAHMALSCAGYLRAATHEGVRVELPNAPRDVIEPGAMAAVSFPLAGKSMGFTSRVLEVETTDTGTLRVTLDVPEALQAGNNRASVRIPVPDKTLSVAFVQGEKPELVQPIDLSLHGILIEFPADRVPDISAGHRRMIVLKLGDRKVLLEAEVRRRDGARYGLAFIIRGTRPTAFVRIISQLQYLTTAT
jgi:hypothetical protein